MWRLKISQLNVAELGQDAARKAAKRIIYLSSNDWMWEEHPCTVILAQTLLDKGRALYASYCLWKIGLTAEGLVRVALNELFGEKRPIAQEMLRELGIRNIVNVLNEQIDERGNFRKIQLTLSKCKYSTLDNLLSDLVSKEVSEEAIATLSDIGALLEGDRVQSTPFRLYLRENYECVLAIATQIQ